MEVVHSVEDPPHQRGNLFAGEGVVGCHAVLEQPADSPMPDVIHLQEDVERGLFEAAQFDYVGVAGHLQQAGLVTQPIYPCFLH